MDHGAVHPEQHVSNKSGSTERTEAKAKRADTVAPDKSKATGPTERTEAKAERSNTDGPTNAAAKGSNRTKARKMQRRYGKLLRKLENAKLSGTEGAKAPSGVAMPGNGKPKPASKPTTASKNQRKKAPLARSAATDEGDKPGDTAATEGTSKQGPTGVAKATPKRARSDESGNTLPPAKKRTFKDVVVSDLTVYVVNKLHPVGEIGEVQGNTIMAALKSDIKEYLRTKPSRAPTFSGILYQKGNIRIVCDDKYSLEYLRCAVKKIAGIFADCELDVVSHANVPRWKTVKVFIPRTDDTTEEIRELLALHNPNMLVNGWHHFQTGKAGDGVILIMGVDRQAEQKLVEAKGKLHYGFEVVRAKFAQSHSNNEPDRQAESAAD